MNDSFARCQMQVDTYKPKTAVPHWQSRVPKLTFFKHHEMKQTTQMGIIST